MNDAVIALLAFGLLVGGVIVYQRRRQGASSPAPVPADVGGTSSPVANLPNVATLAPAEAIALDAVLRVNAEMGDWFDPVDVMAVIEIESGFNPAAVNMRDPGGGAWGLMQVLVTTARDRGFAGDPRELLDPVTGVAYGMAQLRWTYDFLAARLGSPSAAQWIGAYNAGVGNVLAGYIPTSYVAKWSRARERWARMLPLLLVA